MDAFEYLSVLISIILGLGITQLLLGFARWLERRGSFGAYPPAIAWAAFLLLVHVQTWWSMYGLRHHADWNFLQFAVVLLQPIVMFLLAVLIFPSAGAVERDLRANFLEQRPWFFGLFLALLGVSVLKDLVRTDSLPSPANLGFHGALAALALAGLTLNGERAQSWIGYGACALFSLYIALLFAVL